LYDAAATHATYGRLAEAARAIAGAGYTAVLDAAFLERSQRTRMIDVARSLAAPVTAVRACASGPLLRSRITSRLCDASEATVSILERQIATIEDISSSEGLSVIEANTTHGIDDAVVRQVAAAIEADRDSAVDPESIRQLRS
jgi:predicted kinase